MPAMKRHPLLNVNEAPAWQFIQVVSYLLEHRKHPFGRCPTNEQQKVDSEGPGKQCTHLVHADGRLPHTDSRAELQGAAARLGWECHPLGQGHLGRE